MAKLSFDLPDVGFFVEVRFVHNSGEPKLSEYKVFCTVLPGDDVLIKPSISYDGQNT